MDNVLTHPALRLYAICSAILVLQLIALALWTGTIRARSKVFVNAEDAKLNKANHSEADHDDVQRVKRAHMNALENAVPFFIVGLLYAFSGPSKVGAQAYFFTFVGARILHSIFYLWGRQPFRTLCFAIGALATIGMAVHVLRVAI